MKKIILEGIKEFINEKKSSEWVRNQYSGNNNTEKGDEDKEKSSGDEGKEYEGLYNRVKKELSNDLYNHAHIMRQLNWDGNDDTNRSLFRKKLEREKMSDSNETYKFDKSELEKILSVIHNASDN